MSAVEIILRVLDVGALVTFVIFLITRRDNRKNEFGKVYAKLEEIQNESAEQDRRIEKKMRKLEKDIVRTQLLQLMQSYTPENEHELMQVAEHYFSKDHLHANWYMTGMFNRFISKHGIAQPEWLEGKE